jgi:hypothetical protein
MMMKHSKRDKHTHRRKNVVIFDLDGTLALIDKRREHASRGSKMDWAKFFYPDNVWMDEPNEPVIALYRTLTAQGYECPIFSGRSDRMRETTLLWLRKHIFGLGQGLKFDLTMRVEGNFEKDADLKRKWLHSRFHLDEIMFVVDDRDSVVDMWRDEGLSCFQVAKGDF